MSVYIRWFFSFFVLIFSAKSFAQNSTPNSFDLYYSTKVNTSLSLELIVVDNNLNDNITYSLVSNPANGTASLSGSTVTYTPSNNYIGTDTFTFKANDGTADSDTKTVSIKVFKQYKTSFELLHTFKGESAEDGFGRSVAISDDNNTIAIGAFRNDGGGSNSGHVRVFRKSSGAWLQMGNDIDGENAGDYSGVSVDLSSDGNVLAVGAYLDDNSNGTNKGQVKVTQPLAGGMGVAQHMPSQADVLNMPQNVNTGNTSLISDLPVAPPNQQPNNQVPQMDLGPMAANEALGGGFGSMW